MFCKTCGAQIPDDSAFCICCGTPLKAEEPAPAEEPVAQEPIAQEPAAEPAYDYGYGYDQSPFPEPSAEPAKPQMDGKKIGIIAGIAVAAVAVIVLLFSLLFGGGPEALAKKYMKAYAKGDAKTIVNMMHKDVLEERLDSMDMDKDECIEQLEEFFEDYEDELEDLEWEIKKVKEYDKDDEEFEDVEEYYDDEFDLKVKGVAEVKISFKLGKDKTTITLMMVKIGGKWYTAS